MIMRAPQTMKSVPVFSQPTQHDTKSALLCSPADLQPLLSFRVPLQHFGSAVCVLVAVPGRTD